MCTGDKINGNFPVRHARFGDGTSRSLSIGRQQTLAIRLADGRIFVENCRGDPAIRVNSEFGIRNSTRVRTGKRVPLLERSRSRAGQARGRYRVRLSREFPASRVRAADISPSRAGKLTDARR